MFKLYSLFSKYYFSPQSRTKNYLKPTYFEIVKNLFKKSMKSKCYNQLNTNNLSQMRCALFIDIFRFKRKSVKRNSENVISLLGTFHFIPFYFKMEKK